MISWPPSFFGLLKPRAPRVTTPDRLDVHFQGAVYAVRVTRKATARRLILRVRSDTGETVLTLPPRTPIAQARDFLTRHGGWIAARQARLPGRVPFLPGSVIPLRGMPHRIEHREMLRGGVDCLPPEREGEPARLLVSCAAQHIERRVLDYLKAEARRDLTAASNRHAARLGVTLLRITIKDTRSRWGSCSAKGALAYSWRIILAPAFVLEYLAAHEVSHRREMNHSARYWQVVAGLDPRWQEAENWLTRHGVELHRYGPVGGTPAGC
jgi:predicted metal-dependent hydrolase